jgi:hypothetical protein
VYWVAHHRRRDFSVGLPTVKAIIGDKFIPGWLDYYLAAIGYDAQQTQEPVVPGRRDNLYAPLPGDYGARGEFSHRALNFSFQAWLNRYRAWVALGGLGLAAWWWQGRSIRSLLENGAARSRRASPRSFFRSSFDMPAHR